MCNYALFSAVSFILIFSVNGFFIPNLQKLFSPTTTAAASIDGNQTNYPTNSSTKVFAADSGSIGNETRIEGATTTAPPTKKSKKTIPAIRLPLDIFGLSGLSLGQNEKGDLEVGVDRGIQLGNTKIGDKVKITAGQEGGGIETEGGLEVDGEKFGIGRQVGVGIKDKKVDLTGGTDIHLGNQEEGGALGNVFGNFFKQLGQIFGTRNTGRK